MTHSSRAAQGGLLALAALMLAACAQKGHDHAAMHAMHHGAMAPSAAPTTPLKMAPSTHTLVGGYQKVAAPPEARLYFVNLRNGLVVRSPVKVVFGLSGMGVAPAGVEKAGTGHHHLLIDMAEVDVNNPLPTGDQARHFDLGQTETSVALPPGPHTLQLLLGDQNHIPHHPVVLSERITIMVR